MRTQNGMRITIDPTGDYSNAQFTYTHSGDGEVVISFSAADSTDLAEIVLHNFSKYPQEFQTLILSYCIRFLTDQGYNIRKAGC